MQLDHVNLIFVKICLIFIFFVAFVIHPGKSHPCKKWVLQTDREYEITIEVYTKAKQKIHPSKVILLLDFHC